MRIGMRGCFRYGAGGVDLIIMYNTVPGSQLTPSLSSNLEKVNIQVPGKLIFRLEG